MAGTTDTSNATHDDPVLAAALSEMEQDSAGAVSAEAVDSTQDEPQGDAGPNPADDIPAPVSDPATPGDAGQTAPADAPSSSDEDPFAGSEPFAFRVDGETRTMDGVFRVPGEGIYVPEEKVPAFQLMASRAEGLERQNRELYHRTQEYDRLSQWKATGPDGTERTLTGRDALEAREVEIAQLRARVQVAEAALLNPETFASLVSVNAQGQVIPNTQQLRMLATEQQLAIRDAADQARAKFTSSYQSHTQATQQAQQSAEAPRMLWQQADQVWGHEFPQLTAQDKTFLAGQVARYIRSANPDEVQAGQFRPGELVLDPSFYTVMQDRAALRGHVTTVANTQTKAQQFNQAQQQGRKGPAVRPATSSPAPSPSAVTSKKSRGEVWDEVLTQGLRDLSVGT